MARRAKYSEARFALIPAEVLNSEACMSLPDYAFRCLVALASFNRTRLRAEERKANPGNNGDLSLPASIAAKQFGIKPTWRVSAGLQMCRHARLIEITRTGKIHNGKGVAQLYGLCWLPIAPSDKYDQPRMLPRPAANEWINWKRPENWKEIEREVRERAQGTKMSHSTRLDRKAMFRSTRLEQPRSIRLDRNNETADQPVLIPSERSAVGGMGLRVQVDGPSTVQQNERSAEGRVAKGRSAIPALKSSPEKTGGRQKVEKLMRTLPHLPDADIAHMTGEPIELVQKVRELIHVDVD